MNWMHSGRWSSRFWSSSSFTLSSSRRKGGATGEDAPLRGGPNSAARALDAAGGGRSTEKWAVFGSVAVLVKNFAMSHCLIGRDWNGRLKSGLDYCRFGDASLMSLEDQFQIRPIGWWRDEERGLARVSSRGQGIEAFLYSRCITNQRC
jgi:hypothetical protein